MASYDWLTPLIGFAGAMLGSLATGGMAWAIWRHQQRQQKELFEREWQRRLAHEQQTKINDARDATKALQRQQQTDEDRYRDWVNQQYRSLNITGLRTRAPVEVELERVYVSLSVDPWAIAHLTETEVARRPGSDDFSHLLGQREQHPLSIAEALSAIDHERIAGLVILGGPGTGKTTVLRYLALTYARGLQGERLDQSQPLLPLFIPLRTVTADHAPSLADYMTQLCDRLGCGVEPGFFAAQLRAKRCLVLLDGLDEVANEGQRRAVSRWIAEQSRAYRHNPFIVTCRPAGFREDFLPSGFLRLEVQDFGESQVGAFAQNWCLAVETMLRGDTAEARNKADSDSADLIRAIGANEGVQALAVNPLLLSIIALVHRYRARLPDRRVDLYAECVEVLLGHWDEAKAMQVPIPPGRALQVLQPLALWMHEHKSEETERLAQFGEIESTIIPYLAGIGMPEADAARTFLNSIRDRSGLLVEYGTDVFGFQHQTFQEYLAAKEIAAHQREALLVEHAGEGYWREVTLLYAGLHDTTALLQGMLALPDNCVMAQWRFVQRVQREAIFVAEATRKALAAHPFEVLLRASDAMTAARATVHVERADVDAERLAEAFDATDNSLLKGHLALLLSETGSQRATELLQSQLEHTDEHVQHCCALALAILRPEKRQELDAILMVKIPKGTFSYGDDDMRQIETEGFAIDRFPLTNGQLRHFIEAGGYRERRYWSDEGWTWKESEHVSGLRYIDDERFGRLSFPVVGISWYEAEAYANWAGKRLPTEQEWERAARGDMNQRAYPWGDTFESSWANVDKEIDGVTPVCSYPGGVSPYGLYDMAGNVLEWTDSLFHNELSFRVLRGGSCLLSRAHVWCSARNRNRPYNRRRDLGVRFSSTL